MVAWGEVLSNIWSSLLSNAAVLWRRYFELPVHLFAYGYLHKQTQSLEFRLIRIIENFELHERGLFST